MSPPLLVLNKPPDIYKYKKNNNKRTIPPDSPLKRNAKRNNSLPLEIIFLEENDRLMLKKVQIHV